MMFLPLLSGIIVGVVLTVIASKLKKKGHSKTTINIYMLASLALGVVLIAYGYTVVRGFEGFAYLLLGSPIVMVSIYTISKTFFSNTKKHQLI
ncbi:YesK family protein [Viridibacillus sp. NPDC093762]|uniref:YesK family protein n=1 Tax=Viridibacillus sp. NPDC093762 TaxID=3390720 RepID=UPI003CFEB2AE